MVSMALEIKPVPQIIELKETAGKQEDTDLIYFEITLAASLINNKQKKKGLDLLDLINKMEPDEELASCVEEAMDENRAVKINAPDL